MLNIAIKTDNFFYECGLFSLIKKAVKGNENADYKIINYQDVEECGENYILFTDMMVFINFFQKSEATLPPFFTLKKVVINISFNAYHLDMIDVVSKLKKIMNISQLNYHEVSGRDFYQLVKLKKHLQLSIAENKVVNLIGQGSNTVDISKRLSCSRKTISAHQRSVIRKLGMKNKVELYKYISAINEYCHSEPMFLCL
jgi:DNA-binding CsgD family transcriptional regulator